MRFRIIVLGAAAVVALASAVKADPPEWETYAGACGDARKPSRLGCIPEHASEVAVVFWACDQPYFYSSSAGDCVLVAPEREIVVSNLGPMVTASDAGGASRVDTVAAAEVPAVLAGPGGCCATEGGIAVDDDGKTICDAGRVLCENGEASPTCLCTP